MLASLLSPTPSTPPPRISQLLPSVKCSTCHQPVPLAELGDHTCEAPPTPVPTLPKPTITPEAATALLPDRLQGRVASPSTASLPRVQVSPQHQRIPSSASARLRINTKAGGSPTKPTFQPKSSPLARSDSEDVQSLSLHNPPRTEMRMQSPSISTPGTAHPSNQDLTPTATIPPPKTGNSSPAPPTPLRGPSPALRPAVPQQRPPFPPSRPGPQPQPAPRPYNGPPPGAPPGSFPQPQRPGPPGGAGHPPHPSAPNHLPPQNPTTVPPHRSFVHPAERGIDTKSGGAAGMAGVGRRGFAAAARAAMFVNPDKPMGPQPLYGRRINGNPGPRYLDIDAASRPTVTPPLSAGSGYSSHSPGPTSPLPQFDLSLGLAPNLKPQVPRTPSPARRFVMPISIPTQPIPPTQIPIPGNTAPSLSSTRPPFFDNSRGKMGELPNPNTTINTNPIPTTRTQSRTPSSASSKSAYSSMSRSRSGKKNTDVLQSPMESESEYGGLAYADSTDYDDDDDHINKDHEDKKGKGKEKEEFPMQEPLVQALNDAASKKGSGRHTQFGSVSLRSRSKSISRADGGGNGSETGVKNGRNLSISSKAISVGRPPLPPTGGGGGSHTPTQSQALSRSDSVSSSYSSTSDSAIRVRARADSSSTVARALGLSQTPPSGYARLGGPGLKGPAGARESRMRSTSAASSGSRSAYSGSQSNVGMEGLLENAAAAMSSPGVKQRSVFGSVSSSGRSAMSDGSSGGRVSRRADTIASSTSSRDERKRRTGANAVVDDDGEGVISGSVVGGGAKSHRSNTVPGHQHQPQQVHSPDHRGSSNSAANKPVKLPMRSLTSPQLSQVPLHGGGGGGDGSSILTSSSNSRGMKERAGKKKVRACVRCVKSIEDGRWVSVDSGGVLCEKCWKGMYLPKCRRCNLSIERAAVSSSDGQLKGKYHRECFNCHTCHKSFPDKTFYVYDGKPLCAYHYHEANDSLCAAARCRQPIEGPCAVSHTGDRYHPEHMACEFAGGCRERLEEYWEVDGRMLCERHAGVAQGVGAGSGDEEDGEDEEKWSRRGTKAMKRVTRFIDLAGGGGGLTPVAPASVEGSGLR